MNDSHNRLTAALAGQTASLTLLIELLVDRGVISAPDVIARYKQLLADLQKDQGSDPATRAILEATAQFLETKFLARGDGPSSAGPH